MAYETNGQEAANRENRYNLVPTDREVVVYHGGARVLHGERAALRMLEHGDLLRDADLQLGRSDK